MKNNDIVVEEANELSPSVPIHIQVLLSEFSDVIPDEIPLGLPVMRGTQNCIDFIPSSTIPN
ncbi:hypothetical protein CTI12_AA172820 [Artemisia annua]|uniref:Reverse transcriptase domain-containing protein n=1 Tax=Artemisia annua TaxID=35608 RepID=A0A2U1PAM0_ARTAN|nr:hypothetical protein CTI12_AA172820 [Artemisia annua]